MVSICMWFLGGMMSVINRCYAILMPCMNEMKLHSSKPSKSKKGGPPLQSIFLKKEPKQSSLPDSQR